MKTRLRISVLAAVLCAGVLLAGAESATAAGVVRRNKATHRYMYLPMYAALLDLDNLQGLQEIDFGDPLVNVLAPGLVTALISMDLGFTYLEGPAIPSDWLGNPLKFAAVMRDMRRVDVAVHTQGGNILYQSETFNINGTQVPSLVYPPSVSDAEVIHQMHMSGVFYLASEYAGISSGNVVADISTLMAWADLPPRLEVVFRKNFQPYKVLTYDLMADPDSSLGKAFVRDTILEIVNNAQEDVDFVVDARLELRNSPNNRLYPSGRAPINLWTSVVGRYHNCSLMIDSRGLLKSLFEPKLTSWPVSDPATSICPNLQYMWYMPSVLGFLQSMFTKDLGERCFDVDSLVELDAGLWWNMYGYQFVEILTPQPFDDAMARAWLFLHVALNNGHRLIDTNNPVDGNGAQIESVIDVSPFDPETFPYTYDGPPKIHGFHKRLISPSISHLYKRFNYILNAATAEQRQQRQQQFKERLTETITNVHIYVMNPDRPSRKLEISVPELFQMIADRWSSEGAYGLNPPAFLLTDMPLIDRGQGEPVVFEITCWFNLSTTGRGPYVPIRIIVEAHEGAYVTNVYYDMWYQILNWLQYGGPLPF